MNKIVCSVCGKEQELCCTNNSELVEHQMYFDCNFWREMLQLMKVSLNGLALRNLEICPSNINLLALVG